MSEATAAEPTSEELEQKAAEVRDRVQAEKPAAAEGPPPPTDDASETERVRSARCPDCGETWEYKQTRAMGVWLPPTVEEKTCPDCVATAEAAEAEALEAEQRQAAERQVANRSTQLLELLEEAGANATEHRNSRFETFDPSESGELPRAEARAFLDRARTADRYDQVRGLYLFGTTGAGKTHLAVAVCRELLLDTGWSPGDVVFDDALELITRIQDTYNTGASTWELMEERIDARLWVLDDLGQEKPSDDVVRRLTLILNRRALRPTLVTGNYSPAEFENRATDFFRIGSRLGPQYFRAVPVEGRDRRHDQVDEEEAE